MDIEISFPSPPLPLRGIERRYIFARIGDNIEPARVGVGCGDDAATAAAAIVVFGS